MRKIDLKEHETSKSYRLSVSERDQLRDVVAVSLDGTSRGKEGRDTTFVPAQPSARSKSATCRCSSRPKIGIPQLLSLACYALGVYRPQDKLFDFTKATALPDMYWPWR